MGHVMYMRKGDAHTAPVAPVRGIPASDLAVGNSVYINISGVPTEFLVVHSGNPDTTKYDASCDGVWLLAKGVYTKMFLGGTSMWESYEGLDVHSYLNGEFFSMFDSSVQEIIRDAKIPYIQVTGSGADCVYTVRKGSAGVAAKVFLLSALELGFTASDYSGIYVTNRNESACLNYFNGAANSKRIAKLNGSGTSYSTRTAHSGNHIIHVKDNGAGYTYPTIAEHGVRPALILPYDALFDEKTMVLKGAS